MSEIIKFKDIFMFLKKSKIKASLGLSHGKYPFYTSSKILKKYLDEAIFNEKEALIFGTGGLASIHYIKGEFSTSTDCFIVKSDKKNIDVKYIYHYLFGNIEILEEGFHGAGLKHISKKYIENIEIPLPTITKQKQIAKTLDKAQELIELRRESIKKLDTLSKSIFIDMFGDPVSNPKKISKLKLNQIANIQTGNTPPRKDIDNYGDYIEWIKSDNILKDKYNMSKAKEYLSEKGCLKGRIVPSNSLLVTCIAGSMASIGNVNISDRKVAFNQQINSITPYKDNVYYLYYAIKLSKKYIEENSSKSMKIMINKTKFSDLAFPVPDITLQNNFANKIQKIEQQKALYEEQLIKLQENFDALLAQSFKA